MKKLKTLRRGAVLAALTLSLTALSGTTANAAESTPRSYTDSTFSFILGQKGATSGTAWRSKDTSTSSYMHVSSSSGTSPLLFIDGARNSNGSGTKNCTNGGNVRAPGVGSYEIHNTVYEQGYRFARLTSWADQGAGRLSGKWSSDCQGNYTDLN